MRSNTLVETDQKHGNGMLLHKLSKSTSLVGRAIACCDDVRPDAQVDGLPIVSEGVVEQWNRQYAFAAAPCG